MSTPFQSDCDRKGSALAEYNNQRLRRQTCGTCGVIRSMHHYSNPTCRFKRMNDREWADWCGVELPPEDNYLREVMETIPGGLAGLYYFTLECGHRDSRLLSGPSPKIPTTLKCATCAKETGERKMSWINGKLRADASVTAPAPVAEPERTLVVTNNGDGSTKELTVPRRAFSAEVARFMPVMDIEQAVARREVIVQAMKRLMVEGVDYGKIPGSTKPALMQPGADKLCNLFGLTLKYEFLVKEEDWTGERHGGEPFFYYQVRTEVFRGDFLIAEGVGACHSWETKYRWRKGERVCPQCGKAAIIKGREEYGGGWVCFKRKDGCGAKYYDGDQSIEGQETGRKPNPDALDCVNTVLKMAYKRCKIHGTINGTSASEFFTQDLEDFSISDEPPIDTGGYPEGTSQAAQHVAEQKLAGKKPMFATKSWKNMREIADDFKAMREKVGEVAWRGELERYGWTSFQDMRNAIDNRAPNAREKAAELYAHLEVIAKGGK